MVDLYIETSKIIKKLIEKEKVKSTKKGKMVIVKKGKYEVNKRNRVNF